ncbi:MAG: response regulator [Verrucomicrobiota bacterium]|jgi:signal transduction histidine kinase/DNA-binding NtrC family response regulator
MTTIANNGQRHAKGAEAPDAPEHRLLIIDDTAGIHEDFRKLLRQEEPSPVDQTETALFGRNSVSPERKRFLIDSAYQGQEGLELVRRAVAEGRPYSLAFVDVRMPPGWDGIETTQRLWEADPHLQIVICTAYSDYSWSDMARSLGQTELLVFLKKPFDTIEVVQLVYALTAKWKLSCQARRRLQELDQLVAQRTLQLCSANEKLLADIAERKRTESRLSAFAALGSRLGAAQNASQAAQVIVEVADQLVGWDACTCALYSPAEDRLFHLLSMDIIDGHRKECSPPFPLQKPTGLAEKAIRQGGQLVLRENLQAVCPESLRFGDTTRLSASILFVPIRNGASVIGALSIQSYTPHAYDQQSLETLQALADHCGGALNRIKSEETLRQTEQQLRHAQKMEAIGQLAGGVAHDFNNLLAVILGNAELAMNHDSPAPARSAACLKQIVEAANRAANLTRQLLAFGRKQVVQAEALNLNNLITHLDNMLQRIIGEDIQLCCACAENLPLIWADAGMLDQVIMNLAVNSRDAMPGGGQLHIATQAVDFDASSVLTHPESRSGRFVCLSVRDTGCGIPPEHLSRIFEPFFTTKEMGKGTGLGLATLFGIVKQHQGWVEVASTVGVGTAFQVFLPALDAIQSAPVPSEAKSGARGGNEVILLVEDDSAVRQISRRFLENAGYQLLEASSGRQALDVWAGCDGRIDLLLTDLVMPGGINGLTLAQHLTAAKPALKVLFMSGYSADILGRQTTPAQPAKSRFLRKPCARIELLRAVRDYLDENGDL